MKKQELIHLHGLLCEVSDHFEELLDEPLETPEYENQEVRPTSIHKSKTEHKEAVFALAQDITESMEEKEISYANEDWLDKGSPGGHYGSLYERIEDIVLAEGTIVFDDTLNGDYFGINREDLIREMGENNMTNPEKLISNLNVGGYGKDYLYQDDERVIIRSDVGPDVDAEQPLSH